MRSGTWTALMLAGLTWAIAGCADRALMQESIRAAQKRQAEARSARETLQLMYPGYEGLDLALLFDEDLFDHRAINSTVDNKGTKPSARGRFGGAAVFTGGAVIDIESVPISAEGTCSLWFRPALSADTSAEMRLLDGNGFCFLILRGTPRAIFTDTESSKVLVSDERVQNGRWTHLAMTWGRGLFTFYVDGEVAGAKPYSGKPKWSARNTIIGARWTGQDREFTGDMDEVCFYRRALQHNEIMAIHQKGLGHKKDA